LTFDYPDIPQLSWDLYMKYIRKNKVIYLLAKANIAFIIYMNRLAKSRINCAKSYLWDAFCFNWRKKEY
jgi:hypothetical protein